MSIPTLFFLAMCIALSFVLIVVGSSMLSWHFRRQGQRQLSNALLGFTIVLSLLYLLLLVFLIPHAQENKGAFLVFLPVAILFQLVILWIIRPTLLRWNSFRRVFLSIDILLMLGGLIAEFFYWRGI